MALDCSRQWGKAHLPRGAVARAGGGRQSSVNSQPRKWTGLEALNQFIPRSDFFSSQCSEFESHPGAMLRSRFQGI